MTSVGDFSDLAYLFKSEPAELVPTEATPKQEPEQQQEPQEQTDYESGLRDSLAESAVIPRDSFFDTPPPLPPKDTRPNKNIYELPAEPLQASIRVLLEGLSGKHEKKDHVQSTHDDLTRHSSSTSGDIEIHLPLSTFNPKEKTLKNTMYTMHPLMLSPPSPIPAQIPQMPRMPKRPTRPSSLQLPSSLARKQDLTTSVVVVLGPDRPETADSYQTQPHTRYTGWAGTKYGRGKHAATELVPQPSDDPQDPLNWQSWRKELHLYALLVTVALCNVMKTALLSVNNMLAEEFGVSYVAMSALTGVPLMLAAITGMASCTASKIWGRRPVYLISMIVIFIGLVWNTHITANYAQFMVARMFQGLGWGAFDTLVSCSIIDTYFEHERATKTAIYRIVSVATTWGPILLGGLASQTARGFNLQFEILAIFQILSIPLIVLGAPESMYDRSVALLEKSTPGWTPRTGWSSLGLKSSSRFQRLPAWARGRGSHIDKAIQYVKDVARPKSYSGVADGVVGQSLLLQTPFAMVAPTTVLVFLASFLPYSLLWGFSSSLSGLFSHAPFDLFPSTVGSLLATTFILSSVAVAIFSLWPAWSETHKAFKIESTHLFVLAAGTALSFIGILAFGLYISPRLNEGDQGLRFSALSFVLGLLAAGAYVLDASRKPLIRRSTQFTAPNLVVSLRNEGDMDAGVTIWQTLFAGIFVMAIPAVVVANSAGLKSTGIGVAVMQVIVAGVIGAGWYKHDEDIRRLDGTVMRCVDLTFLMNPRSFFEF